MKLQLKKVKGSSRIKSLRNIPSTETDSAATDLFAVPCSYLILIALHVYSLSHMQMVHFVRRAMLQVVATTSNIVGEV